MHAWTLNLLVLILFFFFLIYISGYCRTMAGLIEKYMKYNREIPAEEPKDKQVNMVCEFRHRYFPTIN